MGKVIKAVQDRVEATWSLTKSTLATLSLWGLIFSMVTIGQLRVAFDYDDTLVFSTPAFTRAFASGVQPFSPRFWGIVNTHYDLERIKPLPYAMAWAFRILGFKITVITARPAHEGDALKKEWRYLASRFIFASGSANKHKHLKNGNHVLYFGDSDSDILQGRKAKVLTLRIKRSRKSSYKQDYNPGRLREIVLPLTEF